MKIIKQASLPSVLLSDAVRKTKFLFFLQLTNYRQFIQVKINLSRRSFTEMKGGLLERIQLCLIAERYKMLRILN